MNAPTPEQLREMMTQATAAIAARVALHGYTFVGVVDPEDTTRCWTYSVGMASHGFPDVVLVGLHPHQAEPILDGLVSAMLEGKVDPRDPAVYGPDLDLEYSVAFRLRGPVTTSEPGWPMPVARLFPPECDAVEGWVVQLLWPDAAGVFPTDEADTITVEGVAIHQHLFAIGEPRG